MECLLRLQLMAYIFYWSDKECTIDGTRHETACELIEQRQLVRLKASQFVIFSRIPIDESMSCKVVHRKDGPLVDSLRRHRGQG